MLGALSLAIRHHTSQNALLVARFNFTDFTPDVQILKSEWRAPRTIIHLPATVSQQAPLRSRHQSELPQIRRGSQSSSRLLQARIRPRSSPRRCLRLLEHPEEAGALAANARRLVETTYDWSAVGQRLDQIYFELVRRKSGQAGGCNP